MLSFAPFHKWHKQQKKKKTDLMKECGFAPNTVTKIFGNKFPVRSDVIQTICRVYNLKIEQVIEYVE